MMKVGSLLAFHFLLLLHATSNSGSSAWTCPPSPRARKSVHQQSSQLLVVDDDFMFTSGPVIVGSALLIGLASQFFINGLSSGNKGLGAYLRDGSGFGGSAYDANAKKEDDAIGGGDPLPWLKLPKLDFVEVAGQEPSLEETLELMRQRLAVAVEENDLQTATALKGDLEKLMTDNGFEFYEEGDR